MNKAQIDKDELSELQRKGMEQVEKSSDYQIKAAKEGSKYEFVDYWYSSEKQKCMWCSCPHCKHIYIIEHEDSGQRLSVGSTCIEKIMGLGGSYDKHEKFKEKIDTLAEIKDLNKSELSEKYGDELLTLGKIENEISEEKERKRQEKERKLEEQKKMLEEENLLKLKGMNNFVNDVLNQAERKELSDKQIEALEENRDELLENWDSVEEWAEAKDRELAIIECLNFIKLSKHRSHLKRASGNGREVAKSMVKQSADAYRRPALSDDQIDYALDIIEQEAQTVQDGISLKYGDRKEENASDVLTDEVIERLDIDEEDLRKLDGKAYLVCSDDDCDLKHPIDHNEVRAMEDYLVGEECKKCEKGKMEITYEVDG